MPDKQSMRCIFYIDMGQRHGFGHAGRCRLLATQLAAHGVQCLFKGVPPEHQAFLAPFETSPDYGAEKCDIAIVDSYHLSPESRRNIRAHTQLLVVVDDFADAPCAADVVINHNLYAEDLDYSAYGDAKLLLGPRHALLDPAFVKIRTRPPARNGCIVMTFGLSDIARALLHLAPVVARQASRRVIAVVPERFLKSVQGSALHCDGGVEFVAPRPLHELFVAGECLITGLGVTYMEALASGRPVIGVMLIDNQLMTWRKARNLSLPVCKAPKPSLLKDALHELDKTPEDAWQQLHDALDGKGALRVAQALLDCL